MTNFSSLFLLPNPFQFFNDELVIIFLWSSFFWSCNFFCFFFYFFSVIFWTYLRSFICSSSLWPALFSLALELWALAVVLIRHYPHPERAMCFRSGESIATSVIQCMQGCYLPVWRFGCRDLRFWLLLFIFCFSLSATLRPAWRKSSWLKSIRNTRSTSSVRRDIFPSFIDRCVPPFPS